jgi:hypothetical protein
MHVTLNVIYHQWGERERERDEAYASLQETAIKWLSLCSNDACTRACKLINAGVNKHKRDACIFIYK